MSLFGCVNEQSLQAILITLGFKVNEKYAYFHGEIAKCYKFKGKEEDTADKLRSILAQFEFTAKIKKFVADGVPFDNHLHIPEVHPLTGILFCQREDEGHLFKVELLYEAISKINKVCCVIL